MVGSVSIQIIPNSFNFIVPFFSFLLKTGSKRIFAGSFSRDRCIQSRYQPFIFWTNESLSDCVYAKSKCNQEGQLIYKDESTYEDSTCRCDYKKSYSFVNTPRHVCYCISSEEDCSCYIKSCPVNFTLSAGIFY